MDVVPSPNAGTNDNYLNGVAAISATDVWAVGYYINGTGVNQTLVEHWNGSAWSVVPSPNVGTTYDNYLKGVAAVSATNVWAVGYYYNGTVYQTLMEHWNGSAWSVVSSPNAGTSYDNYLTGVGAVSSTDVWAVGSYFNFSQQQTLVERYNPCSSTATPTRSPTGTPTRTSTPNAPSATPIRTNTVVAPTSTRTNTPTNTAVATNTRTNTPTNTAVVPTHTPTNTPTGTVMVPTNTRTNTPTNTAVIPTNTQTNTPTTTAMVPTNTPVHTATLTNTPAPLPSSTSQGAPTFTYTPAPPSTPTASPTNTYTPTAQTPTIAPTITPVSCTLQFSDVPVGSTFYPYIHCLACMGIINMRVRSVAIRQSSVSRSSSYSPRTVWVLPTSTARSISRV